MALHGSVRGCRRAIVRPHLLASAGALATANPSCGSVGCVPLLIHPPTADPPSDPRSAVCSQWQYIRRFPRADVLMSSDLLRATRGYNHTGLEDASGFGADYNIGAPSRVHPAKRALTLAPGCAPVPTRGTAGLTRLQATFSFATPPLSSSNDGATRASSRPPRGISSYLRWSCAQAGAAP